MAELTIAVLPDKYCLACRSAVWKSLLPLLLCGLVAADMWRPQSIPSLRPIWDICHSLQGKVALLPVSCGLVLVVLPHCTRQ